MDPAAQFDRIIALALALCAHRQHADFLAIFLAEQRQRACRYRIVRSHQPGLDCLVSADLGVYLSLDRGDFLACERLGMREIEAETVVRNQRALLGDVIAQLVTQSGVEQMG